MDGSAAQNEKAPTTVSFKLQSAPKTTHPGACMPGTVMGPKTTHPGTCMPGTVMGPKATHPGAYMPGTVRELLLG